MSKITFDVEHFQLIGYWVETAETGRISHNQFTHVTPRTSTWSKEVGSVGNPLNVKFTITGVGDDAIPPEGKCTTSVDAQKLSPPILLSIPGGRDKAEGSESYAIKIGYLQPIANGFLAATIGPKTAKRKKVRAKKSKTKTASRKKRKKRK